MYLKSKEPINQEYYQLIKDRIDWGKSLNDQWPLLKNRNAYILDYLAENLQEIVEKQINFEEFQSLVGAPSSLNIYRVLEALDITSWKLITRFPYYTEQTIPLKMKKEAKFSNLLPLEKYSKNDNIKRKEFKNEY